METIQTKRSTKDRAWELYLQMRSQDLTSKETDLIAQAIVYADQFDQMFYSYYKDKQSKPYKNE